VPVADPWKRLTTVKIVGELVIPDMAAVILASPGATLVAKPDEDMVAALVVSLVHVTLEVMSAVEPSE
jgi:hypothetical protein